MPVHDAALLLLGHGSTLNADSSAPTYQHAEEIRRRHLFADVQVGFWKEEPNFRQALRQIRLRKIYVVPNFISSGYFTEQVIPRELGLSGPVTQIGLQEVYYCPPVGLHPAMTDVLLARAREVVALSEEDIAAPEKTACLFICGHGTSLNDNSTRIIHDQVEVIRKKKIYADCQAVLMEQKPFVKDWRMLTSCPDVIVVPFFISDGLHSYEDIPVLLGLTPNRRERTFANPHHENGWRLWYSNAIGTEPAMVDVIYAQAKKFRREHKEIKRRTARVKNAAFPALTHFAFKTESWTIGQINIRRKGILFTLTHVDDVAMESEKLRHIDFEALRALIRTDAENSFRPLNASPNLRRGWILENVWGIETVLAALDYFYPAAIANWSLWRTGKLTITPWEETADRQSGRFRIVTELPPSGLEALAAKHCTSGCLKRRLWSPVEQPVTPGDHEIPLLCPEACNFLVEKARALLKGGNDEE